MAKSRAKNAGRPRKDAPRTGSGQLSRRLLHSIDGFDPSTVKRLVELGLTEARTLGLGTPLGRLMMAGRLTTLEFSAGRLLDRLMRSSHTALDAPKPDPKGSSIGNGAGGSPVDPDTEAGQRQAKEHAAIAAATAAAIARMDTHGVKAARLVLSFCEGLGESLTTYEDELLVKSVLYDLACYWELTKKPSSALN